MLGVLDRSAIHESDIVVASYLQRSPASCHYREVSILACDHRLADGLRGDAAGDDSECPRSAGSRMAIVGDDHLIGTLILTGRRGDREVRRGRAAVLTAVREGDAALLPIVIQRSLARGDDGEMGVLLIGHGLIGRRRDDLAVQAIAPLAPALRGDTACVQEISGRRQVSIKYGHRADNAIRAAAHRGPGGTIPLGDVISGRAVRGFEKPARIKPAMVGGQRINPVVHARSHAAQAGGCAGYPCVM